MVVGFVKLSVVVVDEENVVLMFLCMMYDYFEYVLCGDWIEV